MQQIFLVKTITKKTIEVEGKLVKGTKVPQPPSWFSNWTQDFEESINKRFDKQEDFNQKVIQRFDNIDSRLDKLDNRINNLVQLNNLKE